jgi:hypothetical protein
VRDGPLKHAPFARFDQLGQPVLDMFRCVGNADIPNLSRGTGIPPIILPVGSLYSQESGFPESLDLRPVHLIRVSGNLSQTSRHSDQSLCSGFADIRWLPGSRYRPEYRSRICGHEDRRYSPIGSHRSSRRRECQGNAGFPHLGFQAVGIARGVRRGRRNGPRSYNSHARTCPIGSSQLAFRGLLLRSGCRQRLRSNLAL